MKERLKNWILNKYIGVRLKFITLEKEAQNFPALIQRIKNILVLLPIDNILDNHVEQFISALYKVFTDATISTFERKSFRKSDGNWFGLPSDTYMRHFTEESFDLVIDLTSENDRLSAYICALSGAPLRLRLFEGNFPHIYNLHIRTDPQKPLPERLNSILEQMRVFKEGLK